MPGSPTVQSHSDPHHSLLIVEDDPLLCESLADHFDCSPFRVRKAHTGRQGLQIVARERIDVILLDQKLPDGQGTDFCRTFIEQNEQAKIIFMTAYPSFENAVDAIKLGAYDYLSKPFDLNELDLIVAKALKTADLERIEQVQSYQNRKKQANTILIGGRGGLMEVDRLAGLAAGSDAPVLITGETGTGKNQVARSIHFRSPSGKSAFISLNCATLPENLIESELFGYEKGAFTGADAARKGIFEMAQGGTLFLDEIGELPLHLQSKLLGVLDEKNIKRLGGQTARRVDVRVIAATNVDLDEAIAGRRFRQDLYYRLGVLHIHVPPLRERPKDVADLCRFFIDKIAPGHRLTLADGELDCLMRYHWPGNVRELRNVIERAIILRRDGRLGPSKLLQTGPDGAGADTVQSAAAAFGQNAVPMPLQELEKRHIHNALEVMNRNHTRVARALGISRSTLIRKIKQYGLA